ncbi:MAG: siroheme synthase [Caulobacteraceae bacterium]|nr:siroheme synthase [Caulobacteraceae bacterium]
MDSFPAFFPLAGAQVVVAGEGAGAEAKARLFAGAPSEVVRLTGPAARVPDSYRGASLVFVADADEDFLRDSARAARACGAPLNVVDHPELSDFHTPAIVDRGQVVAAVGTAGAAPLLASLLRGQLETRLSPAVGELAALVGAQRERLKTLYPDLTIRRAVLRRMLDGPAADAILDGDLARAAQLLDEALATGGASLGRVVAIEPPDAPDLLSLRAARVLNSADAIVLGPHPLAADIARAHGRRDADRLAAGDRLAGEVAGRVARGEIVAVIGGPADLVEALQSGRVSMERLAPAPR